MKNKAKLSSALKCAAVSSIVLSIIIGAAYFLAMKTGFNPVIGHFDPTPWFWIFSIGIAAAAVIALVCAVLCRGYGFSAPETTIAETTVRAASAALSLFIFAQFIMGVFVEHLYFTKLNKAAGILLVFIAIAFICSMLQPRVSRAFTAVAFILAALAVNINIFSYYFNFSLPVNSPVRNVAIIMQCAVLLFMIAEARLSLPRESGRSTAQFAAFVYLVTFTLCFGLTLAAIVFNAAFPDAGVPNLDSGRLALFLCISILSIFRFVKIAQNLTEPEKDKAENKD